MNTKKPMGLPVIAVIAAVLVGVGAASFEQFRSRMQPAETGPAIARQPNPDLSKDSESTQNAGSTRSEQLASYVEPDVEIWAGQGIVLKAAREGGGFVGFEIIDGSGDSRLVPGGIIVAINGMPVEDSAAGSELLVAALADQNSQIVFAGEER